ncbi:UNVERIFIED_CONTAM: hypothetical protein FKN15_044934 [Acipenser sinensis]
MALNSRRDAPEPPDFSLLKRLARDQLIYLLEQLPGKKDLFIEADLMSPLDRIANVSTLKGFAVTVSVPISHCTCKPTFYACETILEEQGIYGDVSCDKWEFYLLPLDDDIISLELPEFFRDYFLEGDQRWVSTAGKALHLLHSVYGPFSKVYGIGRCAKMTYEIWRELVEDGEQRPRQPEVGNVFLIDRELCVFFSFQQHEVDKLYKLENKPIVSTCDQLCFLIRPRIHSVKWIADIVNTDKAAGRFRRYKIIFSPQKFYACETILEEQGIYGDVSCDKWEFYLLPLDDDIISLELPEFFRDYFLEGDQRWVSTAGKALHLLHSVYGPFSKVYGIGRCAKMTYEIWRELVEDGEQRPRQPEVGNVFLIDRGSVEFGPEVTSSDKSLKVMLNSSDKVFNEIRNEHFSNVFGFLSQKAKSLQTAYDKRRGMDIQQMKTFVSQELKGLKQEHRLLSLRLLEGFNIRESISNIEEHINRQVSLTESLRLLCLLSLTENGLIPKDYRSLKAQYLQSYGTEHLLTFANLRKLGLLVEQQPGDTIIAMENKVGKLVTDKAVGKLTDAFNSLAKKSNFRALSKKLALIPKVDGEYDLCTPPDMAYIFSGAYVPLSCKLVEQVLDRGWTGLEEVTRLLNGNEFSVTAGGSGGEVKTKHDSQRLVFVMFLGGCTFSEISALRFLGRERGYKFIIVTTAITNSTRLLESVLDSRRVNCVSLFLASEVLAAESVACLNKALSHLKDIWEEIGIPEDQRLQRTDVVKKHIKGLLDMMISEEESLRERLLNSIALCRKELDTLCMELRLPPFEEEEGNTVLQLEKDIRTRLEVMMKQKKERMHDLKALKEQDQDLCDILCTEPYCTDSDAVPSLEELNQFRHHIASLCAEKERRRREFVGIKRQIILCMEELDHTPDTSFERDVVCEEEEAFCLSTENIAMLNQLLNQLEVRKSQNEVLCASYRDRIVELWERLQVPQEERDAFSVHMAGSRPSNIQALQEEAERLHELKLQNIRNVIQAIRAEVVTYWEKCFYSPEQRQAFAPYYDEDYTEDLLSLHDAEILHLKQHYEDHRELFEGVHRWQESWTLYLELDRKATDPSRFTNRGGNLLKEEKQRADLHKNLPKLEKKLKAQIDDWEQEQGREFLVSGQKFLQFVEEQWELHRLEKEREKQERQMKKTKQIEEEMLYGTAPRTPSKRRFLGANTPGKVRKLNATSISSANPNSTVRSAFGGTLCHSPVSRPPLSGSKPVQPVRTPGRSKPPRMGVLERNKENVSQLNGTAMSGAFKGTASPQCNFSSNSVASTYSEFAVIHFSENIYQSLQ